jgi:hypothetical protein
MNTLQEAVCAVAFRNFWHSFRAMYNYFSYLPITASFRKFSDFVYYAEINNLTSTYTVFPSE